MKQIKNIPIGGLSASPSDYLSSDGDLASAIGITHQDGSAIPVRPPVIVADLGNDDVIFSHDNIGYKHLICRRPDGSVYWMTRNEDGSCTTSGSIDLPASTAIHSVASSGNILIISSTNSVSYFYFNDGQYHSLGSNKPYLDVQFGLKLGIYHDVIEHKTDILQNTHGSEMTDYDVTDDEDINRLTNAVLGVSNKMHNKMASECKFTQPFFACVCYELFDGSMSLITGPVLMIPCSGKNPFVCPENESLAVDIFYGKLELFASISDEKKAELRKWKDIIKRIVVFVSAPIYQFNPDGRCNKVGRYASRDIYNLFAVGSDVHIDACPYRKRSLWDVHEANGWRNPSDTIYDEPTGRVTYYPLPDRDTDILDYTKSIGTMYRVFEQSIDSLINDGVKLKDRSLVNITTLPTMPNDFFSLDTIAPDSQVSYNNRLNLINVTRIPFSDFLPSRFIQKQTVNPDLSTGTDTYQLKASINENGSSASVVSRQESLPSQVYIPHLFYPDPSVEIMKLVTPTRSGDIKTEEHEALNGVVYLNMDGLQLDRPNPDGIEASHSTTGSIEQRSSVYTSEVNNPFIFRAANVEQVGNGRIIAMAPAAQALSSGQFGEFPMYCFTTEGVWALSVSQTGGWASKQPISRDVMIDNPEMLLQLDQSVIFATDRGLMMISGSNIDCITEVFDGKDDVFTTLYATHINQVASQHTDLGTAIVPSFHSFCRDGSMHYDYRHQLIYVSNSNYSFSYVYSMKDRLWSVSPVKVLHAINSYPDDLSVAVFGSTRRLVNFSADFGNHLQIPGSFFILTRPLKFDTPDELKTVSEVIVRGDFQVSIITKRADVSIILYGSRDLHSWHTIGSCRGERLTLHHGSPFKYFRVAVLGHLSQGESITSLTIEYELKQTNRIR